MRKYLTLAALALAAAIFMLPVQTQASSFKLDGVQAGDSAVHMVAKKKRKAKKKKKKKKKARKPRKKKKGMSKAKPEMKK